MICFTVLLHNVLFFAFVEILEIVKEIGLEILEIVKVLETKWCNEWNDFE